MNTNFLKTTELPYCKGCGHHFIAKNTAIALEKIEVNPLDVVLVTDIGCHGIIDYCFNTHTVHGLHGRSVALGAGIAMGLSNPKKKVLVFIGDGGVTIGLQHLLEAIRLNINMTVIIHNNLLYGMTGGQASGLTPCGFKTTITPEGNSLRNYDICALAHSAGAVYIRRIICRGSFSDELAEAFKVNGFSLVEVVELCPSYGVKLNPGRKLDTIIEGQAIGVWQTKNESTYSLQYRQNLPSLFEKTPEINVEYESKLRKPFSIILGGSAGEGVQLAGVLLARAAIASGLHATKKGSYPVTVGVGFSTAEIILSPRQIHFHGITEPDTIIITSKDGLAHNMERIMGMKGGMLFIDESLESPETGARVISHNFRQLGAKNAAIYAVFFFVQDSGLIPLPALIKVIEDSELVSKIPIKKIKEALES